MYWTAPFGKADLVQRAVDHLNQRQIAAQRFTAAAQYGGVAGLEAEGSNIDGHVGTRFIDDADHTDGNATPAQTQTIG